MSVTRTRSVLYSLARPAAQLNQSFIGLVTFPNVPEGRLTRPSGLVS